MSLFWDAVGFGIASGAVIALGAVGFTVQFAVSSYFNIAYGALLTLAAFTGYWLLQTGMSVWLCMAAAAPLLAVASIVLYRVVLAPLKRRGAALINVLIATLAAAIALQYTLVAIAGPDALSYGDHWGGTVAILGFTWTAAQVAIIVVAGVVMVALHLLLTRTRLGRAMRGIASNPDLAKACGVRTERIIDVAWALTGAMCGLAGVALAITTVVFDFSIGYTAMVYVIAAAVLGGVGQPYGAMLGAVVVGIASQLAAAYSNPAFADVVALGILAVVLVVKPAGLLGASGGFSLQTR